MRNIEVCLSPKLLDLFNLENKIAVVVDVLRASTIITTMLKNGAEKIIPVESLEIAKEYKAKGFLVAAERKGKKVDFADFDNSPYSFTPEIVKGKSIVYSTLNGTNTINLVKDARQVLIASFLNLNVVVDLLSSFENDIIIVCSGWQGNYCSEDVLLAGAISEKLIQTKKFRTTCDASNSAIDLWGIAKGNLFEYIKKTFQYKRLTSLGLGHVIEYCFTIGTTGIIPFLKDGYIIDFKKIL
ncbi:MAG TPA: 2-phosphosulfolactate phosphatase [Bacteroidales bacterium]|nr:2-phosphosulfolactate phosphatase [Bacteroidales bacterium]